MLLWATLSKDYKAVKRKSEDLLSKWFVSWVSICQPKYWCIIKSSCPVLLKISWAILARKYRKRHWSLWMFYVKIWNKIVLNNISIIFFLNWMKWFRITNTQCSWNNCQCHVLVHAFKLKESISRSMQLIYVSTCIPLSTKLFSSLNWVRNK